MAFRPIEADDVRFLWAAYQKGALAPMQLPEGLAAYPFRGEIEQRIVTSYDGAWTLLAETKRGFVPVGCVFAHWGGAGAAFMVVDGIVWFPWASPRNRIESAVSFFRAIHHEAPMIGYAREEDRRMYEICMAHGIMRRIGTSYNVFDDEAAAVYETRALQ